jgi:hypothetical protein
MSYIYTEETKTTYQLKITKNDDFSYSCLWDDYSPVYEKYAKSMGWSIFKYDGNKLMNHISTMANLRKTLIESPNQIILLVDGYNYCLLTLYKLVKHQVSFKERDYSANDLYDLYDNHVNDQIKIKHHQLYAHSVNDAYNIDENHLKKVFGSLLCKHLSKKKQLVPDTVTFTLTFDYMHIGNNAFYQDIIVYLNLEKLMKYYGFKYDLDIQSESIKFTCDLKSETYGEIIKDYMRNYVPAILRQIIDEFRYPFEMRIFKTSGTFIDPLVIREQNWPHVSCGTNEIFCHKEASCRKTS